ncbi:MAG: hypothetical protein M1838_001556 [Thelocarpon superellum]|nr:MAG: hypothetical protein M1838_001556 [Thelocarpon superellum]
MATRESSTETTDRLKTTPSTAILSLEEDGTRQASRPASSLQSTPKPALPSTSRDIEELSTLAYNIVAHPSVFITPAILESYVKSQTLLQRPQTFPEVFQLYTSKVVTGSSSPPNPNQVKNAIPPAVAKAALDSAMEIKDLTLSLAVIETTFATSAFRRSQVFYRALPGIVGAALAPFAAYTVASQLSLYQSSMAPQTATNLAFVAILAYLGFTASIGMVALTTANDQMDRVTWASGIPLRERWLREEERSALDRVASAWGFRERWRRGEEEGADWEALKEWIGRRGMVLDKTELMEGMQ